MNMVFKLVSKKNSLLCRDRMTGQYLTVGLVYNQLDRAFLCSQ